MGSRDKVLIVDDSELDRIALKKMLKDAYEIVEAVDGAGALRILESQKEFDAISAIILDLVMPQMDGFEFLREYRKVDLPEPDAPMMLVTSPGLTEKSMSRRTSWLPKVFER